MSFGNNNNEIVMDEHERRLLRNLEIIQKDSGTNHLRELYGKALSLHDMDFKVPREITIVCASYNVGEANARSIGNMADWFRIKDSPDVIAICLQEVDMRAQAFVMQGKKKELWHAEFKRQLGKDYTVIGSLLLVGLVLEVWVKNCHTLHLRNVRAGSCATGTMGMGNKGGLSVRFSLYHRRFAFVGTHFASGREKWNHRNQTYHNILNSIHFDLPPNADDDIDHFVHTPWEPVIMDYTRPQNPLAQSTIVDKCPQLLERHDYVFWLGDLNYRLLSNDKDRCLRSIEEKKWAELLQEDQLSISRKDRQAFNLFQESNITFAPTYKYDVGAQVYDTSDKARTPSWTDRILYFVQQPSLAGDFTTNNLLEVLEYNRVEYMLSDHRPVSAAFRVATAKSELTPLLRYLSYVSADLQPTAFSIEQSSDYKAAFEDKTRKWYETIRPGKELALARAVQGGVTWSSILEGLRKESADLAVGRYGFPMTRQEALREVEDEERNARRQMGFAELRARRISYSFQQTALGEILSRELAQESTESLEEGKTSFGSTLGKSVSKSLANFGSWVAISPRGGSKRKEVSSGFRNSKSQVPLFSDGSWTGSTMDVVSSPIESEPSIAAARAERRTTPNQTPRRNATPPPSTPRDSSSHAPPAPSGSYSDNESDEVDEDVLQHLMEGYSPHHEARTVGGPLLMIPNPQPHPSIMVPTPMASSLSLPPCSRVKLPPVDEFPPGIRLWIQAAAENNNVSRRLKYVAYRLWSLARVAVSDADQKNIGDVMYERSIEARTITKEKQKASQEEKIKKEMAGCTFKPTISKKSQGLQGHTLDQMFEKCTAWAKKKTLKLEGKKKSAEAKFFEENFQKFSLSGKSKDMVEKKKTPSLSTRSSRFTETCTAQSALKYHENETFSPVVNFHTFKSDRDVTKRLFVDDVQDREKHKVERMEAHEKEKTETLYDERTGQQLFVPNAMPMVTRNGTRVALSSLTKVDRDKFMKSRHITFVPRARSSEGRRDMDKVVSDIMEEARKMEKKKLKKIHMDAQADLQKMKFKPDLDSHSKELVAQKGYTSIISSKSRSVTPQSVPVVPTTTMRLPPKEYDTLMQNFAQRNDTWRQKHKKITDKKREICLEEAMKECTFKPELSQTTRDLAGQQQFFTMEPPLLPPRSASSNPHKVSSRSPSSAYSPSPVGLVGGFYQPLAGRSLSHPLFDDKALAPPPYRAPTFLSPPSWIAPQPQSSLPRTNSEATAGRSKFEGVTAYAKELTGLAGAWEDFENVTRTF